jgi:hypothetical protein
MMIVSDVTVEMVEQLQEVLDAKAERVLGGILSIEAECELFLRSYLSRYKSAC